MKPQVVELDNDEGGRTVFVVLEFDNARELALFHWITERDIALLNTLRNGFCGFYWRKDLPMGTPGELSDMLRSILMAMAPVAVRVIQGELFANEDIEEGEE